MPKANSIGRATHPVHGSSPADESRLREPRTGTERGFIVRCADVLRLEKIGADRSLLSSRGRLDPQHPVVARVGGLHCHLDAGPVSSTRPLPSWPGAPPAEPTAPRLSPAPLGKQFALTPIQQCSSSTISQRPITGTGFLFQVPASLDLVRFQQSWSPSSNIMSPFDCVPKRRGNWLPSSATADPIKVSGMTCQPSRRRSGQLIEAHCARSGTLDIETDLCCTRRTSISALACLVGCSSLCITSPLMAYPGAFCSGYRDCLRLPLSGAAGLAATEDHSIQQWRSDSSSRHAAQGLWLIATGSFGLPRRRSPATPKANTWSATPSLTVELQPLKRQPSARCSVSL